MTATDAGVGRIVATTAIALAVLGVPSPASGRSVSQEESQFTSLTNSERRSRGLTGYAVASDLVSIARRHAARMAAKKTIWHNPNLGSEVRNWRVVGENVGKGPSVESIHRALMNSASHRANILDREFTQVGMGTAFDSDGLVYVTQVFRQPYSAPSAPAPVVRPPPTARPQPVPRAVPPPSRARPDVRAVLARKLNVAQRIAARERPHTSVARAFTYVKVMRALV